MQRKGLMFAAFLSIVLLMQTVRLCALTSNQFNVTQLCTAQGMVNVFVEPSPNSSDHLDAHHGDTCCGMCSVALFTPNSNLVTTITKTPLVVFFAFEQVPVRLNLISWLTLQPQPPPKHFSA